MEVEMAESVESDTGGDSVVELNCVLSRNFDADVWVRVSEMGWDVDECSVLVLAFSVAVTGKAVELNTVAASDVWFVVFVVVVEAEGVLRVWLKSEVK